jgi:hypothetical protein
MEPTLARGMIPSSINLNPALDILQRSAGLLKRFHLSHPLLFSARELF